MATGGELVSTHMLKKLRVENWLLECQLLASITLPLGSTVCMYVLYVCVCVCACVRACVRACVCVYVCTYIYQELCVGVSKQKSVLYSPYKHKCSILGSYRTL